MANDVRPVLLLSRPPPRQHLDDDGGRGQRQRKADEHGGTGAGTEQRRDDADDDRRDGDLQRAEPEHQTAHGQQPCERQLEPDDEEEEHDAELGHGAEAALLGDGHPLAAAASTR